MAINLQLSTEEATRLAYALLLSIGSHEQARQAQTRPDFAGMARAHEENIQSSWTVLINLASQIPPVHNDPLRSRMNETLGTLQRSSLAFPWENGFNLEAIPST